MKITLLACTPNAEALVATAAHTCVSDDSMPAFFSDMQYPWGIIPPEKVFQRPLSMGHTSILEHVSFSFAVEGVSRSLSHQLVRFRIASFSQQSQRYVRLGPGNLAHVIPPSIQANNDLLGLYEDFMELAAEAYQRLVDGGIPAEDARFVLPNACETKLLMTMNAREILHACSLRECTHAQWEIRAMFNEIHRLVEAEVPSIFRGRLGPPCVVAGTCPEGPRSCGRIRINDEEA